MPELMLVEVAYASEEDQLIQSVHVPHGCKAVDAIKKSGILECFPEIEIENIKIGIFGKGCTLETILNSRDRVEIYRQLKIDPKDARKKRAAEGKDMRKGARDSKKKIL